MRTRCVSFRKVAHLQVAILLTANDRFTDKETPFLAYVIIAEMKSVSFITNRILTMKQPCSASIRLIYVQFVIGPTTTRPRNTSPDAR